MNSSSARSFLESMQENEHLQKLLPQIRQNQMLQSICTDFMPEIFNQCSVLKLESDVLTVSSPNASIAYRLRQEIPSLIEHFANSDVKVNAIRVKVQPKNTPKTTHQVEEKIIPKQVLNSFSKLAEKIKKSQPESRLYKTIMKLIKNHQKCQVGDHSSEG